MTTSRPKTSTLFSIAIFSVPLLIVGIIGFNRLLDNPEWYHYAMAVIGTPIGAGLIVRQIVSYKSITVGKKKITINHLLRLKAISYPIADIEYWKEEIVKTGAGTYKETEIKMGKISLKISKQEYSNYDKVVTYLKKNCSRKYIKT